MPNFSSLAHLEVPEKFVWWVGGWGLQSHFHGQPNRCVEVRIGWGFDNKDNNNTFNRVLPHLKLSLLGTLLSQMISNGMKIVKTGYQKENMRMQLTHIFTSFCRENLKRKFVFFCLEDFRIAHHSVKKFSNIAKLKRLRDCSTVDHKRIKEPIYSAGKIKHAG